ncbi:hypothetical protein RQM47_09375 [Rubrivirga sp. S365]|uniref:Uncharacterized protein n=1 Tax=Rubrivirga litoralis TaxID=3075598 RepID=A0ABU3BMP9_9BACT|nr:MULTISPECIES: hypothetical protein [unclassified Rubrivirga]MDT0630535.1 hypothetical protein [Rubrivirga sp. F394]MDT7856850.1 hypothetical protein [Rubrivirga sp. S365]
MLHFAFVAALTLVAAAARAQPAAPTAELVNLYAVVEAEGAEEAVSTSSSMPVEDGTLVWVRSCDRATDDGALCWVLVDAPDVSYALLDMPRRDLRFLKPVAPITADARGTGAPNGFEIVWDETDWAVGPSFSALSARAGPSTDYRTLFEVERASEDVIRLEACAPKTDGAAGRWCLAEVHGPGDLLDYSGTSSRVGFVYTAALVPYVFDMGEEYE